MRYSAILKYFDDSAKSGEWNSLYDPKNPSSYSFIVRLQKAINLAGSFRNKKALDLGCGTGVLMPFVLNDEGQYTGLDISKEMLDEIQRIYPSYANKENAGFIFGDIRKVQLPDRLDTIIGLGFIEYIENPEDIIQMLYDKLLPGGRLILSFPNSFSLDHMCLLSLTPLRFIAKTIFNRFTYQPQRKLWSLKTAKELYLKAGFKNLKFVNYNVNIFAYPITRISMSFVNFWAKRFEYSKLSNHSFFATGFIISGEK